MFIVSLYFLSLDYFSVLLSNIVPMILIVPTEFLCMIAVSTSWFKYYELHTTKWLFLCLNIYVWSKPLCLNTYIIIKIFFNGDLSYIIWGCKSTLRQMQVPPLCFYGQITLLLFPNKKLSESRGWPKYSPHREGKTLRAQPVFLMSPTSLIDNK